MRSDLPAGLTEAIAETLQDGDDTSAIRGTQRVAGGDINEAVRVETAQAAYFVKWNPKPLVHLFEVEARGLNLLAAPAAIRVPEVYGFGEPADGRPAFIVLEWIEQNGTGRSAAGEVFGQQLAELHRTTAPVLIDPAVYHGHREIELAFTELFGGFPASFYAAYDEAYPLSPDYEERRPLYQLYHLLTHLNLFGETYGGSVDRILRRYTS